MKTNESVGARRDNFKYTKLRAVPVCATSPIPNRDPCPVCGQGTFCPNHYFGLSNDLIMVEQTNKLEHWDRVGPMIPFDKVKHIPKPVGNFFRIYVM